MDYEQDVQIDDTALDVEWLNQASLAMKYGKNYAKCKRRVALAEENIKVITAELIKEANDDPDKCLGTDVKATGPNVESYYRNHKRHKAAKQEWIDAVYELDMAEIAKNEIAFTRKVALENLVKLHGQMYFAGPKIPRDLHSEVAKRNRQDEADNVVSKGMTRNRK